MLHWPVKKADIANMLTLSRMILLPVIVVLFLIPKAWAAWAALALYAPAAATDYLDGYFARLYNQTSRVGIFLDPIADKLFVGAILFMLAATGRLEGWWAVPALLIMLREIFIAGLREFLAEVAVNMPVTRLAKWKTGVQMTAIGFLIMWPYVTPEWFSILVEWIGKGGLIIAMVLTLKTGWDYTVKAWPYLKG